MEFYGYKKCSTCRNAHKFLADHGVDVPFQDFVQNPPSVEQLKAWIAKRNEGVLPFVNTKGTRYRELNLADKQLSEAEWLDLLSTDGKLLKRPVLVTDEEVVLGFDRPAYERIVTAK
ncbi:Spx/MgsR family RNA polymerase-binding regulatory protein [Alicyclobacillus cycloheptanicus]|uniref:Arsenate reductase n=1 Tax=Alicyclobacillus cycloheptanicus TaxID=1457 RepID=A0ABT9XGC3_9BACL|nr:Spx/MgsR family RNA polymerase-binding regulatory protein [Alicyclobacillus cycloheptanicus]MDQ0188806.1 arsenate reductase [Alicyclobacillus cycloheptanicus]WDM00543.1 Spx/MgsR family RNA polymerase-binding regulatory protein [Alicyclobacillus cycloheptanicus]